MSLVVVLWCRLGLVHTPYSSFIWKEQKTTVKTPTNNDVVLDRVGLIVLWKLNFILTVLLDDIGTERQTCLLCSLVVTSHLISQISFDGQ